MILKKSHAFKNRADCIEVEQAIDQALRSKEIRLIPEPYWFVHPVDEMGQAVFFERVSDRSIWIFLAPERVSLGYWKRIK